MIFDDSQLNTPVGVEAPDLNMYEMGATAAGALIAVNGVAVCAATAPVYTGVLGITAGSLWYVGDCKRSGRKLNFFARDTKVKTKVDETSTEITEPDSVPTAETEPVQVQNFDGEPVMI